MNRRNKTSVSLLLMATSTGFLVLLIVHAYRRHAAGDRDPRITTLIATLKNETLERSVSLATRDSQQYHIPGFQTALMCPQVNLEDMLSARRAVKILQTIERLPEIPREAGIRQAFATAFQVHTSAVYAVMRHSEDPSYEPNQQSLYSTRLGLCVAMFAAAEWGRKDLLSAQLEQLDRLRSEVDTRVAGHKLVYSNGVGSFLQDVVTPDDRFEVNVIRVLASHQHGSRDLVQRIDEECGRVNMRRDPEIPVAAWDAWATWFERGLRGQRSSKEVVKAFTFWNWDPDDLIYAANFDDRRQKALVQRLRALALR